MYMKYAIGDSTCARFPWIRSVGGHVPFHYMSIHQTCLLQLVWMEVLNAASSSSGYLILSPTTTTTNMEFILNHVKFSVLTWPQPQLLFLQQHYYKAITRHSPLQTPQRFIEGRRWFEASFGPLKRRWRAINWQPQGGNSPGNWDGMGGI